MDVLIKTRNVSLNESLRAYLEKKVQRLSRFLNQIQEIRVEVREEKTRNAHHRSVAQLTAYIPGLPIVRVEERGETIREAFDVAMDVMERRLQKLKDRRFRRDFRKAHAGQPKGLSDLMLQEALPSVPEGPRVVTVKQFCLKPMSLEETVEQMELLGHDFFVFRSADTGRFSVLYRRRDGNYGLIESEMA